MILALVVSVLLSMVAVLVYVAVVGIFPTSYECPHDLYSGWARLAHIREETRFGHPWSTVFGVVQCYSAEGEWAPVTMEIQLAPLTDCPDLATPESIRSVETLMSKQCAPLPFYIHSSSRFLVQTPEGSPLIFDKSRILDSIQVRGSGEMFVVDRGSYIAPRSESNGQWLALRQISRNGSITFVPLRSAVGWPPSSLVERQGRITPRSIVYDRLQIVGDQDNRWLVAREFEPHPASRESYGRIEVSIASFEESFDTIRPGQDDTCSICISKVVPPIDHPQLCRHWFHEHCLTRWLSMPGVARVCPMCQSPITTVRLRPPRLTHAGTTSPDSITGD